MNDIVDRLRGQEPLHLGDRSAAADVIERLRAELAEARKPDCHSCNWFNARDVSCVLEGGESECVNGDNYEYADPLRLYEKEGKV